MHGQLWACRGASSGLDLRGWEGTCTQVPVERPSRDGSVATTWPGLQRLSLPSCSRPDLFPSLKAFLATLAARPWPSAGGSILPAHTAHAPSLMRRQGG